MYPIEYARDEGIEDGNGGNGAVEDGGQDKTSEGKDVGGEYIEGEDAANQKAEYENDESQDAKYEVVGDEEAENKRAHWREDGKQRLIDQIDQCEDEGYKLVNFRLPVPDYNMSAFDVLTAISPFLADWDDLECAVHALEIRLDDPQLAPFRAGHSTKADEGIYYHWSTGVHNCCVVDEIIGANRAADQRPHSMCISEVDTGDVDYPEFRKNLVPEETQQGDLILHLRRKLPLVIDEEGYEKLPQGAEDDTQSEESQQKDHDAQPKKLQGDEVIDFHKLFDEVERDNMVLNTALVIRPDWGKDGFLVLGFSIDLGRCSQKYRLRRGEKMGGWSRTLAYVSFLASVPEMIPLVVPRGPTTTRMLLDFRVPFLHGFDTYMYTPHEDQVGYFVAVDYHGRWPSTEEENKRWVAERNIYITLV